MYFNRRLLLCYNAEQIVPFLFCIRLCLFVLEGNIHSTSYYWCGGLKNKGVFYLCLEPFFSHLAEYNPVLSQTFSTDLPRCLTWRGIKNCPTVQSAGEKKNATSRDFSEVQSLLIDIPRAKTDKLTQSSYLLSVWLNLILSDWIPEAETVKWGWGWGWGSGEKSRDKASANGADDVNEQIFLVFSAAHLRGELIWILTCFRR